MWFRTGVRLKKNESPYRVTCKDINPLDDILEYGSGFEFGTDDSSKIEVEFKVKSEEVLPQKDTMQHSEYFDLLQDYVCSCSIRVARDMFALLPVQHVIVHAVDKDMTILSVDFSRVPMVDIRFNFIDPSDVIEKFNHYMKFNKLVGFNEVQRIK